MFTFGQASPQYPHKNLPECSFFIIQCLRRVFIERARKHQQELLINGSGNGEMFVGSKQILKHCDQHRSLGCVGDIFQRLEDASSDLRQSTGDGMRN
jgi:hypothetical protein